MNFSIRGLLAVTLLLAIVFVGYREHLVTEKAKQQIGDVQAEVEVLRTQVAVEGVDLTALVKWKNDDMRTLKTIAANARKGFEVIRDKELNLTSLGNDVFSYRLIPTLKDSFESHVELLCHVPKERPFWLCMGVKTDDDEYTASNEMGKIDFLRDSMIAKTGPYQVRLPEGTYSIVFSFLENRSTCPRIEIRLKDKLVFRSVVEDDAAISVTPISWVSPRNQVDIKRGRDLPWLLDAAVRRDVDPVNVLRLKFWLGGKSLEFENFPEDIHE